MKKRTFVEPGYIAFNGYVFTEYDCKRYNYYQDRINRFIEAGLPVRESLLNDSHITFCMIIGCYK